MCIFAVTPLVGVWIEILFPSRMHSSSGCVTPLVGVWIEICAALKFSKDVSVTPLVGVWIEIPFGEIKKCAPVGHSPCGSVD